MTKEEIIKRGHEKFPQDIIEIINDDGSITRNDVNFKLREAYMKGLIDNNISLPSNLDEAALKELQVYLPQGNGPDGICYFIAPQMLAMYEAGAEWMAGLGETKEGEVLDRDEFIKFSDGTYIDLDPTLGLIPAFKLKDGDKVVVQIRKK